MDGKRRIECVRREKNNVLTFELHRRASSVRSAMKFKRQNVVFFSANALDPTFSVHGSTSSPPFPMAPPRALAALVALVAATLVADAAATDAFSEARTLGRAEFVSCPA